VEKRGTWGVWYKAQAKTECNPSEPGIGGVPTVYTDVERRHSSIGSKRPPTLMEIPKKRKMRSAHFCSFFIPLI